MAPEQQDGELVEILLVEPNPGDSRLFTEQFADAKILNNVHTVTDGETALAFLHQREEYQDRPKPDLIVLEPRLPGKSGRDILVELRNEPVLADIPVIVLTGSQVEEEIVKSRDIEADSYIQKPVETDEFIDFVQSVENFWLGIVRGNGESD